MGGMVCRKNHVSSTPIDTPWPRANECGTAMGNVSEPGTTIIARNKASKHPLFVVAVRREL